LAIPDQGAQMAENLARLGWLDRGPIPFEGPPSLANKVRICSEGHAELCWMKRVNWKVRTSAPAVILPLEHYLRHPLPGDEVKNVATGYDDLPPGELAMALREGRLAEYLQSRRSWFQLVIHRTNAAE
jgi:hypothetical protein